MADKASKLEKITCIMVVNKEYLIYNKFTLA